jgi:pSer/pThr/pTyr-binding forkhead associated (FHA) protein
MEFHLRLDKFQQKYARMAKADFVAMFNKPFLVFDLQGTPLNVKDFDTYASTATATESTKVSDDPETDRITQIMVAPIEKTERGKDPTFITLGRAPENDIVIPHPAISKSHALFRRDPEKGGYTIQDAGSSFGTAVGGADLVKGAGLPLKSGEQILFSGYISATILAPQDFYDFMARMGKKKP